MSFIKEIFKYRKARLLKNYYEVCVSCEIRNTILILVIIYTSIKGI